MSLESVKQVAEYGMGVVSFMLLVTMIWQIIPVLRQMEKKISSVIAQNQEVIRNNTLALQEQAKANENVANALALIGNSTSTVCASLEKHDQRAEAMMIDIVKMRSELGHAMNRGITV